MRTATPTKSSSRHKPSSMTDFLIINHNTPELTAAAVRSVMKHTEDSRVTVWDNGTVRPMQPINGVTIIDNAHGQVIDYDRFLMDYPDKVQTTINDWGSAKHCKTIDYCMDIFRDGFIAMDSDAILTADPTPIADPFVVFAAEILFNPSNKHQQIARALPTLCWLNVPLMRKHGVTYFNGQRMWKLTPGKGKWYDTGAWLLEQCIKKELPFTEFKLDRYCAHLGMGSYRNKDWRNFLKKNER